MEKSLGGNRLGSGSKMNVNLHGFERSSHNLSRVWRSTMSAGTLVPFLVEVGLPGDTFDIDLNTMVRTQPTVAPLFGSFKLQLDVFMTPVRLFNASLHMNRIGVGLNMSSIYLPQMFINANSKEQFNQSSLLAYLGVRGAPTIQTSAGSYFSKSALEILSYWTIYKNYYANKQEEIGYQIKPYKEIWDIVSVEWQDSTSTRTAVTLNTITGLISMDREDMIGIFITTTSKVNHDLRLIGEEDGLAFAKKLEELGQVDYLSETEIYVYLNGERSIKLTQISPPYYESPKYTLSLQPFDLSNIDDVNLQILQAPINVPYVLDTGETAPYNTSLSYIDGISSNSTTQNGLGIKTYQSDLFNNWLSTDFLLQINTISAVNTTGGSFTMDTLNLAKKVYDMLNRVAVSGGSYEDWQQAIWGEDAVRKAESPIYMGGLSTEIIFEEIVSTADSTIGEEHVALGSLAGKGTQSREKKGGFVTVKCTEPCVILGIASITPRIDYSQGNKWFTNLRTMDDYHKPSLDGIGFQELITEQMLHIDSTYNVDTDTYTHKSAGKQPAWINYMTAFNETYGMFADDKDLMAMTLNRQYEISNGTIKDLTTYIDPTKFNYAFAVTGLDAQNFWVQIASDIVARRKMSAKIIPNL